MRWIAWSDCLVGLLGGLQGCPAELVGVRTAGHTIRTAGHGVRTAVHGVRAVDHGVPSEL